MDLGLAGRVVVVTGGTRGLGFATARVLVEEGAAVVVSGRDAAGVAVAVDRLGPERAEGVVADNTDAATADRLVSAARRRFGGLHGCLLSVGGPPTGTVLEVADAAWRDAFEAVFLGAVRIARTTAAALGDGGAMLFVLSTSARAPIAELGISNGLRPGLAMVAKAMADELAPRGVRVNGVLPGSIATERLAEVEAGASAEAARRRRAGIPLGRLGDPAEFGRVAAFLLSPAASYVTGVMVPVDGGALRSP